jgi:hypothetical protein
MVKFGGPCVERQGSRPNYADSSDRPPARLARLILNEAMVINLSDQQSTPRCGPKALYFAKSPDRRGCQCISLCSGYDLDVLTGTKPIRKEIRGHGSVVQGS